MKFFYSLAVLVVLAVFVSSPAISSAQAINPVLAQASAPATPFYAELGPLASSSSSSNAFLYNAPAAQATPAPAKAEGGSGKPFSGLGVGFKIGLSGIGFDVATPLVPTRLNLRGGATFFSYNLSETTSDGLNASGTLKLQNSGIMVDWFPFRGSFRLSGGATVYNNKGFCGSLDVPNGNSFTLGNDKHWANGPLVGTGTFKLGGNAGGRVSFGWGNLVPKPGHRFSFDTELGIEFVSKPTVALGFTGSVCTAAPNCGENAQNAATYAPFLADVAAEQNKLQSDVNFLSFYPIVSVGFGYKLF
jgi:hypothetical protein